MRKNAFLEHYLELKTINLPRQTRDKRSKNVEGKGAFCAGQSWGAYVDYIRNSTGPLIAGFEREVRACSVARCSGHGRCRTLGPPPPASRRLSAAAAGSAAEHKGVGECECFSGFAGPTCATAVLL
eukprot:COSAG06_NODE_196_length_20472_cov_49.724207_3_plen_126_part_00